MSETRISGGTSCAYRGCVSRTGTVKGLSLFKFPKDIARTKTWLVACNREDLLYKDVLDIHNNYKLCEKHFEDRFMSKSVKRKNLFAEAIPTLFTHLKHKASKASISANPLAKIIGVTGCLLKDPNDPSPHLKDETGKSIMQRENIANRIKCCVSECAGKDLGSNVYNFPQSLLLVNMWKSALKFFKSQNVTKLYVCGHHFDERDFIPGTKKLKKMAIPSSRRIDAKQKPTPISKNPTAQCRCKCTCENSQNSPGPPTSKEVPSTNEAVPKQTNGNIVAVPNALGKLSKFEQTEIKINSLLVFDKHARVVINCENPALRKELIEVVQKVLADSTRDVLPVQRTIDKNVSKAPEEVIEIIDDEDLQKNEEILCLNDSRERTALETKEEEEFPVDYLDRFFKMHCQYCGESFPNIVFLTFHVKAVHETSCGPPPLSEAQLISGMKNCKFCNRILNNSDEYIMHVARCISNPLFKGSNETQLCELCGRTLTRIQMRSPCAAAHGTSPGKFHKNKRKSRCSVEGCKKLFNTAACLRNHRRLVHAAPERWKFVCRQCDRRFPRRLNLLVHQDSHSKGGRCDKTVKGQFGSRIHVARSRSKTSGKRAVVVPKRGDDDDEGGGNEADRKRGGSEQRLEEAKRKRESDGSDSELGGSSGSGEISETMDCSSEDEMEGLRGSVCQ